MDEGSFPDGDLERGRAREVRNAGYDRSEDELSL